MIGNDIVDLNLAKTQSNLQRSGFLDKIFTKKEQEFIHNEKRSFEMVWLLWSMKESAYKIYSRQHNTRFFAPKKFECEIDASPKTVKIKSITYFTTFTISEDCIHTVATLNMADLIIADFFKLKNDNYKIQHNTTYKNLKLVISDQFNIPISKVKIQKDNNGIPSVKYLDVLSNFSGRLKKGSVEKSSISMSHHGLFGSYAFLK